jgi:hypothetical protein
MVVEVAEVEGHPLHLDVEVEACPSFQVVVVDHSLTFDETASAYLLRLHSYLHKAAAVAVDEKTFDLALLNLQL